LCRSDECTARMSTRNCCSDRRYATLTSRPRQRRHHLTSALHSLLAQHYRHEPERWFDLSAARPRWAFSPEGWHIETNPDCGRPHPPDCALAESGGHVPEEIGSSFVPMGRPSPQLKGLSSDAPARNGADRRARGEPRKRFRRADGKENGPGARRVGWVEVVVEDGKHDSADGVVPPPPPAEKVVGYVTIENTGSCADQSSTYSGQVMPPHAISRSSQTSNPDNPYPIISPLSLNTHHKMSPVLVRAQLLPRTLAHPYGHTVASRQTQTRTVKANTNISNPTTLHRTTTGTRSILEEIVST
jgi:hypothetical protein